MTLHLAILATTSLLSGMVATRDDAANLRLSPPSPLTLTPAAPADELKELVRAATLDGGSPTTLEEQSRHAADVANDRAVIGGRGLPSGLARLLDLPPLRLPLPRGENEIMPSGGADVLSPRLGGTLKLTKQVSLTGGYESIDQLSRNVSRANVAAPGGSKQLRLDVFDALASIRAAGNDDLSLNLLLGLQGQSAEGVVGQAGSRSYEQNLGLAGVGGAEFVWRMDDSTTLRTRALSSAGGVGLTRVRDLHLTSDFDLGDGSVFSVGLRRGASVLRAGEGGSQPGARLNRNALTLEFKIDF